ncbi:MAG: formate/nitrite transporter family protein [Marinoscillum sp.]
MRDTETAKNDEEILENQHRIGFREYQRSNTSLVLSGFVAGLEIGFSVLLIGVIITNFQEIIPEPWLRFMIALAYPFGFILIILGRSELFTEHTSLAIIPVLKKRASIKELFGLWGFIILGNLTGGFLFALLMSWIGPAKGIITQIAFARMAGPLVEPDWHILLVSAILAGWLMGLLSWLAASVDDSISRIAIITLITFVIGIAHLHHCIVGSVEMLCGLFTSDIVSITDYLHFLFFAVLGNTIGGALFVSILKYAQVKLNPN